MSRAAFIVAILVGCAAESDGGVDSGEEEQRYWDSAFETQEGRFSVVLSPNPDPPQLGDFVLEMQLARNSDNPEFDGALLVNAGVSLFGEQASGGGSLGGAVEAEELGAGKYAASWVFAHPGAWHLRVEIGAAEDKDIALFGLLVED